MSPINVSVLMLMSVHGLEPNSELVNILATIYVRFSSNCNRAYGGSCDDEIYISIEVKAGLMH